MLQFLSIPSYTTEAGVELKDYRLSYEVAGPTLGSAPIVLVHHALTGNSSVAGPEGWWAQLIGPGQTIDSKHYTILAFNIPGNAYDGRDCPLALGFSLRDVAELFGLGLRQLGIETIDTIIGASLGGALSLQLGFLYPRLARQIICIASDYRASDWLLAQTMVQRQILEHSSHPIEDARIHAMLCYRTPASLNLRFGGQVSQRTPELSAIEDWLGYHGRTLASRFSLNAYRVMTSLTGSIRICQKDSELSRIKSIIRLVSIESDLLFTHDRAETLHRSLLVNKPDSTLDVIYSIHGHDAFLMEYEQLNAIVQSYIS